MGLEDDANLNGFKYGYVQILGISLSNFREGFRGTKHHPSHLEKFTVLNPKMENWFR